jgi:DNA polymerase-1
MKLLLVDASYYAYRSFYAIQNLRNAQGEPTNAIYGVIKALKKMVVDVKPDLIGVIFDGGLPEERMLEQPEYKANRSETPADLAVQFDLIEESVAALGMNNILIEGEEADDLIASYAADGLNRGYEVIIATNDKDIMQMVNDTCKIYQPDKDGHKLLGVAEVTEKWGVPPGKIGDILSLIGDKVDNIPGIPGVGPVTATKLIVQFGTVDEVMARADEIDKEKLRETIKANIKQIQSNQRMVKLRAGVTLPVDTPNLVVKPDFEKQVDLFTRCNFKTFLKEAQAQVEKLKAPKPAQSELF